MNCRDETGGYRRSYRKWSSMHRRCIDIGHPSYKRYGGRGISVCDRWSGPNGYNNFVADMGEPPEGMTLGRIDHATHYSPENCRWETWGEQAASRSRKDRKDPTSLRGKCRAVSLPYMVVYHRIKKLGWDETRALSEPVAFRSRRGMTQEQRYHASLVRDGILDGPARDLKNAFATIPPFDISL